METLISVVEVGSTSTRMRLVEFTKNGAAKIIDELTYPVAVGRDTFSIHRISAKTLRALCVALGNFAKVHRDYKTEQVRAIATSALREADNNDLVIDRVQHETGIRLRVLDNIEEGRLMYQLLSPFLTAHLDKSKKHILFMELGGGGTVSMLLRSGKILRANYRRLGTTRFSLLNSDVADMNEQFGESVIRHAVNTALAQFADFTIGECVLLSNSLRRIIRYFPDAQFLTGGFKLTAASVQQQLAQISHLGKLEIIAEHFNLCEEDAASTLPTLLIVNYLCKTQKLKHIHLLDADLLDAAQRDLYLTLSGKNPRQEFREQTLLSARGVGNKYNYDEKHALAVMDLAANLFDDLMEFFDLTARDKLLLEVAAILHDVGAFISEEAHHKHSQYLIQWSEILGVDHSERGLIALIARYHRKTAPLPTHIDFANLPHADRLRVTKLAALLRLADALDRSHLQKIQRVETRIKDGTLQVIANCRGDITIEQSALEEKAALLNAVSGLTIEFRARPFDEP